MSLKAFHIIFISVSSLLALVVAGYAAVEMEGVTRIAWMIGSLASGIVLVAYGNRFLKKMKDVSYL